MSSMAKKIAQGSKTILRREDYLKVKKMDRDTFECFCKNLYNRGFADGRSSVKAIGIEDVKSAIAECKGVGEKRLEQIMRNIEGKLGGEKQ